MNKSRTRNESNLFLLIPVLVLNAKEFCSVQFRLEIPEQNSFQFEKVFYFSKISNLIKKKYFHRRQAMGVRRRRLSSQSSNELLVSVDKNVSFAEDKIFFARKKKPEKQLVIAVQVGAVLISLITSYYIYYHFDHFHFNLLHFYAHHWNDHHAQHTLGHKILEKVRADQRAGAGSANYNESHAMNLFRKSADQGHPESAYNLAAGHLSGFQTDVQKGKFIFNFEPDLI